MVKGYPNLELIEYQFKQEIEKRYPDIFKHYYTTIWMDVFRQVWASTALGFGGCGGSAMTGAYTTVATAVLTPRSSTTTNTIEANPEFFGVYFDGRLAYFIEDRPSNEFFEDLKNRDMVSVQKATERYVKHD